MTGNLAPGWTGNWLNGWLAAIGVTKLVPGARLSWTGDAVPLAAFHFDGDDLASAIADALPSLEALDQMAIARHHPGSDAELSRKVTVAAFADRSRLARASKDGSLEATVTDLAQEDGGSMAHGPLDAAVPKGITLHERLVSVRSAIVGDPREAVRRSLAGHGGRCQGNGLGFDHRRFPAGVQAGAEVAVDPVVELACFFGMSLLPVRGTGTGNGARQRGWGSKILQRHSFTWPAWTPALDLWGIDALLDLVWAPTSESKLRNLGVTGLYGSVAQQPKSSLDSTRGYASERLW